MSTIPRPLHNPEWLNADGTLKPSPLWREDGHDWHPVPQCLADLPRSELRAASELWIAILRLLPWEETDVGVISTIALQGATQASEGFVTKGLRILRRLGIIQVDRVRGRREIRIPAGYLDEPRRIRLGGAP
jgi:hypothetical protein